MSKPNFWSRENGAQIPYHKGLMHESLRGDVTTERPREPEKKTSVFISKNTVHEAKEAAKKDSGKPSLSVED